MERVSLLKQVDVGYSTGTIELFAKGSTDGWIDCNLRLPPDKTPVLIMYNDHIRIGQLDWTAGEVEDNYKPYQYWDCPYKDGQDWEWNDVTHWQYLPKAKAAQ